MLYVENLTETCGMASCACRPRTSRACMYTFSFGVYMWSWFACVSRFECRRNTNKTWKRLPHTPPVCSTNFARIEATLQSCDMLRTNVRNPCFFGVARTYKVTISPWEAIPGTSTPFAKMPFHKPRYPLSHGPSVNTETVACSQTICTFNGSCRAKLPHPTYRPLVGSLGTISVCARWYATHPSYILSFSCRVLTLNRLGFSSVALCMVCLLGVHLLLSWGDGTAWRMVYESIFCMWPKTVRIERRSLVCVRLFLCSMPDMTFCGYLWGRTSAKGCASRLAMELHRTIAGPSVHPPNHRTKPDKNT
jgi:hypothetical protein